MTEGFVKENVFRTIPLVKSFQSQQNGCFKYAFTVFGGFWEGSWGFECFQVSPNLTSQCGRLEYDGIVEYVH